MIALQIRPIRPEDSPAVARVIRAVLPEFGASGPGFAFHDPEVDDLFTAYSAPGLKAAYFVLASAKGEVLGGGGVAPLAGGDGATCELRKMYFLPEARGRGAGHAMLTRCLDAAKALGFTRCYLETLLSMQAARALYAKQGFAPLSKPEGATGHFGCDAWYAKQL